MNQQKINTQPIQIIVYRVTGKQLFFNVPEKICEECDISVAVVRRVVDELAIINQTEVIVKPWINNLLSCLLWRSWHPPVVTINGKRFSQGVVPDKKELIKALQAQLKGVKGYA